VFIWYSNAPAERVVYNRQRSVLDAVSRTSLVRYLSRPDISVDTLCLMSSVSLYHQQQHEEEEKDSTTAQ
jgi:hypothetical protein